MSCLRVKLDLRSGAGLEQIIEALKRVAKLFRYEAYLFLRAGNRVYPISDKKSGELIILPYPKVYEMEKESLRHELVKYLYPFIHADSKLNEDVEIFLVMRIRLSDLDRNIGVGFLAVSNLGTAIICTYTDGASKSLRDFIGENIGMPIPIGGAVDTDTYTAYVYELDHNDAREVAAFTGYDRDELVSRLALYLWSAMRGIDSNRVRNLIFSARYLQAVNQVIKRSDVCRGEPVYVPVYDISTTSYGRIERRELCREKLKLLSKLINTVSLSAILSKLDY